MVQTSDHCPSRQGDEYDFGPAYRPRSARLSEVLYLVTNGNVLISYIAGAPQLRYHQTEHRLSSLVSEMGFLEWDVPWIVALWE